MPAAEDQRDRRLLHPGDQLRDRKPGLDVSPDRVEQQEQTVSMNDLTDMSSNREALELSNIRFHDNNGDGILHAGETAKITFEIRNRTHHIIRDVRPMVVEATGNRNVMVSPGIEVESIAPGSGIKYTATVIATKRLKAGELLFQLSTLYGNDRQSDAQELRIATKRN